MLKIYIQYGSQPQEPGIHGSFKLIRLICIVIGIFAASPVMAEPVDELTREQAQQISENFNALNDSLDQGMEQIEELQHKLALIKQNRKLLDDSKYGAQLQAVIDKLEGQGLSDKLQTTHQSLTMIKQGADSISTSVESIQSEYQKVEEFYEKWHPDRENPVRPLELVANGLEELESIIQKLDPSPDNMLTKPIVSMIAYYKEASRAFASALANVKKQIDERRQNCLGTGCETTSDKGRQLMAAVPGLGPAWLYRTLTGGDEIWYTGEGRTFIWSGGGWIELQGGLSRFQEVYRGWQLAHGEIISSANLVSRMNSNYDQVIAAKQRATRYWELLNSTDACDAEIYSYLNNSNQLDHERVLEDAAHDQETFLARYMFLGQARNSIDAVIDAYEQTMLVKAYITDDAGHDVAGARVTISAPSGSAAATSDSSGSFIVGLRLKPDPSSRQNANIRIEHPDYESWTGDERLWSKCETWTPKLVSKTDNEDMLVEQIRNMEEIASRASGLADDIAGMCRSVDNGYTSIQSRLDELHKTRATGQGNKPVALTVDIDTAVLAQDAETTAKELAESSQHISQLGKSVCEMNSQLGASQDGRQDSILLRDMQSNHTQALQELGGVHAGFNRLQEIKSRAQSMKSGITAKNDGGNESSAMLEPVRSEYEQAQQETGQIQSKFNDLKAARTEGALILAHARQQTSAEKTASARLGELEALFADITASRDRVAECAADAPVRMTALESEIAESEAALAGPASPISQEDIASLDDALSTITIAERFFGVEKMENIVSNSEECLQQAQRRQEQGDAAIAALRECDVRKARTLIERGYSDPQVQRQLQDMIRQEQEANRYYQGAVSSYGECKYEESSAYLQRAYQSTDCRRTRNQLHTHMQTAADAVERDRLTREYFQQANSYYKNGQLNQAYNALTQARMTAVCKAHIAQIDGALNKVSEAGKQQAATRPQLQCDPPRVPGINNKTGEPMCKCPNNLYWSDNRRQCVTFSVVAGEALNQSGIAEKIPTTVDQAPASSQTQSSTGTCTGTPEWCEKLERYKRYRGSIKSAPPGP